MNHLKTHQTNPTTAQYRPVQSNTSTAQYSQVQPIPEPDPKPELFGQTRPEPDPKSKSPTRQTLFIYVLCKGLKEFSGFTQRPTGGLVQVWLSCPTKFNAAAQHSW